MKVKARTGLRVPMEHASRQYITAEKAVDVPDTAYYRRRVAEGDLIDDDASAAESSVNAESLIVVDPGAKKTTKGA